MEEINPSPYLAILAGMLCGLMGVAYLVMNAKPKSVQR
jgi:hypothetical protein